MMLVTKLPGYALVAVVPDSNIREIKEIGLASPPNIVVLNVANSLTSVFNAIERYNNDNYV